MVKKILCSILLLVITLQVNAQWPFTQSYYYKDVGTITPTTTIQNKSGGSYGTSTSIFVKCAFSASLGTTYTFTLTTTGSKASANCLTLLDAACCGTAGTLANNTAGSAHIVWTATYTGMVYILMTDASNCGQLFGVGGSESVSLAYSCNCCALPSVSVTGDGGVYCDSVTLVASGSAGNTIYYQGTTSGGTSTATPDSSITVTSSGTYYFNSSNGACWSTQDSATVTIIGTPTGGTISGPDTVCSGETNVVYTINGVSGTVNAQSWTVPAGANILSGQGSGTISVNFGTATSGNLTCSPSYGPCSEVPVPFAVTVLPSPAPPAVSQNGDTLSVAQGYTSYQWYFQGTSLPGATNYFLVYTQTGNYSVLVTDAKGCSTLTPDSFFVDVTGIAQQMTGNGIRLVQHGGTSQFSVYGLQVKATVELYNILGGKVYSGVMEAKARTFAINNKLPSGIYMMKFESTQGRFIRKIVLQ